MHKSNVESVGDFPSPLQSLTHHLNCELNHARVQEMGRKDGKSFVQLQMCVVQVYDSQLSCPLTVRNVTFSLSGENGF